MYLNDSCYDNLLKTDNYRVTFRKFLIEDLLNFPSMYHKIYQILSKCRPFGDLFGHMVLYRTKVLYIGPYGYTAMGGVTTHIKSGPLSVQHMVMNPWEGSLPIYGMTPSQFIT